MNSHFFTAPFYFAFIWFRGQRVQGGGASHFVILSGEKGRVLKMAYLKIWELSRRI